VAPPDGIDHVKVRFSPRIARWVRERHRDAEVSYDERAVVTFPCASMDWLVRAVLQYGDEAEVLEPVAYREAMRRAVGYGGRFCTRSATSQPAHREPRTITPATPTAYTSPDEVPPTSYSIVLSGAGVQIVVQAVPS